MIRGREKLPQKNNSQKSGGGNVDKRQPTKDSRQKTADKKITDKKAAAPHAGDAAVVKISDGEELAIY